ncbi:hypothetical protein FB446DRAFT_788565 [Lentinula raphanica]|nr:hypothetical protein FB446DRAFT_788565 [Lentinula raphanica]
MTLDLKTREEITQSHIHEQLHAIIIGGSITGLSAAIALQRAGHRTTVLEKDATIDVEFDSGCRIAPNLYKILREWNLETELKKVSSRPETINLLSYDSGSYLGSIAWDQEILKETNGEFSLISYSALRALLYREAISQGACVRFNAKVLALECHANSPSVTLQSGDVVSADLLIGADGVNGITREYITTHGPPPDAQHISKKEVTYEGTGNASARIKNPKVEMFNMSIPKESILNDPQLAYLLDRRENDIFVWLGHEHSAVGFPNGQSNDFSLCVYRLESMQGDLWSSLHGAEPSLLRLSQLASRTSPKPVFAPLAHEDVLDTWTDGRLVVIGEAAHPLPPGSVQSCALSVEDGVVLAKLLSPRSSSSQYPSPAHLRPYIPTLLAAFQSVRYPHCASVQTREVGIIHYMTMPGASGAERDVREQGMRARRDMMEITVVQVPLEIVDCFPTDFDHNSLDRGPPANEGGQTLYDLATACDSSLGMNMGGSMDLLSYWVEIAEVFGYEAEDEAEEWWVTWGRYQITGGTEVFVTEIVDDWSVCDDSEILTY